MSLQYLTFSQDVCGEVKDTEGCANNGKITLTLNGGKEPYTFRWSNSATSKDIENLAAGNYSVIVTDAHCGKVTLNFTVVQDPANSPIKIAYQKNVTSCGIGKLPPGSNGKIEIDVANPSDYTYCWKYENSPTCTYTTQNIADLSLGTYYLTIVNKNTGCQAKLQTNICCCYDDYDPEIEGDTPYPFVCSSTPGFGTPLSVTATPTPPTTAGNNGAISLSISGGKNPNYAIKWSGPVGFSSTGASISGLLANNEYCYTVTDGCSEKTGCIYMYVCEDNPINIAGTLVKPCNHALFTTKGSLSITATGGKPSYKYVWSNGSKSPNLINLTTGTYSVIITDKSGCTKSATFTLDPGVITSEKAINSSCVEIFQCDGIKAHEEPLKITESIEPNPSLCKKYRYCEGTFIGEISGAKRTERDNNDCRIISEYCFIDNNPKTFIRSYKDDTYNKFELDFERCEVFEKCRELNNFGTSKMLYAEGKTITKEWFDCIEPVDCLNPKGTCGRVSFCKLYNPETKKDEEKIIPGSFVANNGIATGVYKSNKNCASGKSVDISCDFSLEPVRKDICATGCPVALKEGETIKFENVSLSSLYIKDYVKMLIEMGEASLSSEIFLPEGVDDCTDLETFNHKIQSIINDNNGISNGYKKKATEILQSSCENKKDAVNVEDTFLIFPNPFEDNVSVKCNSSTIKSYEISVFDNLGRIIMTKKVKNDLPFQTNDINLSHLPNGMYNFQIKDPLNSVIFSKSVIKL